MGNMVTFITVLKSKKESEFKKAGTPRGFDFSSGYAIYETVHVYALKKQIEKHYPHPHRFIVLTDFDDMKCESIKLKHNWPGWWSKIEMFRPDFLSSNPDDVFFYMDLDTCLVGDISCYIDAEYQLCALGEVHAPGLVEGRLGSGVVAWRGNHSDIYNTFVNGPHGETPEIFMERFFVGGDQHFMNQMRPRFTRIQDIDSGCINFKYNLPDKKNIPENAKIIYFHGELKPWQVEHGLCPWLDLSLYNINNY